MRLTAKPEMGSISTGTLVVSDLLRAFMGELDRLAPARAYKIREEHAVAGAVVDENDMLVEANYTLNLIAARYDMYFGAHWGDAADFGFWPMEADDDVQEGTWQN